MFPANKKYYLTPERRSFLERYYHVMSNDEILLHALFRGIPRGCLHRWAGDLGLTRGAKERPWEAWEDNYVSTYSHRSVTFLAKHLNRSRFDVARRMRAKTINKMSNGLTLSEVAYGLGCDKKTVMRWIADGLLKARRRDVEREDAPWLITENDIRDFIREHGRQEVNQHKIQWCFFLDIVFEGLPVKDADH